MEFLQSKKGLFIMGGLAGVIAAILAFSGNPTNMGICIACFIRDTAGAMQLHSASIVQYVRPEIIGMVLGALIISLMTKEYRSTAGSSPMVRFVLGIIIMIGSLLFLGCPLRMVLRMAGGDLNAYVALVGFVLGVGTGVLALKKGFTLGRAHETQKVNGMVMPALLAGILVLSLVATTLFVTSTEGPGSLSAPIIVSLIGGLVFGAIAQKSRMCFAGSMRDVFLMKNFDLLSVIGGVFVVMLIYNAVSGGLNIGFADQAVAHTDHLWNLLGMYIVGFAAVLAGGCPLRQLILTGQGSSDAAVTVVGMFAGAAICHNWSLASSTAGTTEAGRIAGIICIIVLFYIGFVGAKRK